MAVNLAHLEITSDALPGSRRFLESAGAAAEALGECACDQWYNRI